MQVYPRLMNEETGYFLSPVILAAAKKAIVPVCFHLDHGPSETETTRSLRYDATCIMLDGSTLRKKGGIIYDGNTIEEYPAFLVDAVDSNGSGDVFHGAFALTNNMDYNKACIFSSAVSALECTNVGARTGAPDYDETIKFLKERGINV